MNLVQVGIGTCVDAVIVDGPLGSCHVGICSAKKGMMIDGDDAERNAIIAVVRTI